MRIAVAGKGGSGKTTIAGTLARLIGKSRGKVLAIDGDSNPNLAIVLGFSREQAENLTPVPADMLEQATDDSGKARMKLRRTIDEIIAEFGAPAPDGVCLLIAGKVAHAGAG